MDIQSKRFATILILCCFFSFTFAQNWEVSVNYSSIENKISVKALPPLNASNEKISFQQNILGANPKTNLQAAYYVNSEQKKLELKSLQSPFELNDLVYFEYEILLNNQTNVATRAILNFNPILLVNWSEILFQTKDDALISIYFFVDEKQYALPVQTLSQWKSTISEIKPLKPLVEINKISVATNVANTDLKVLMEQTLKNFKYFEAGETKDLYIIFANDSLPSGGAYFQDKIVVYLDAKIIGQDQWLMQQIILHELFHGVSPYKIHPELEAILLDKNWLAEATPEYLSWMYLLQESIISEQEFIAAMEQKLRDMQPFQTVSLNDMSLEIYRKPEYYQAFYTKGCIALFLLDLRIFETTKGMLNIHNLILGKFPELDGEKQLELNNLMHEMEEELVYNNSAYSFNKFISSYGWLYEKQKVMGIDEKTQEAILRKENITYQKMASNEQKELWKRFISKMI
jgi:hypothetical protein